MRGGTWPELSELNEKREQGLYDLAKGGEACWTKVIQILNMKTRQLLRKGGNIERCRVLDQLNNEVSILVRIDRKFKKENTVNQKIWPFRKPWEANTGSCLTILKHFSIFYFSVRSIHS